MNLSFGLRTDADSFSQGSNLLNNVSPRAAFSYSLSENQQWKLNASVGRYFKIPTYTMLGFQDSRSLFVK